MMLGYSSMNSARVPPECVVTLWPQVATGPSKIVSVLPSMRRSNVVSVVQQLGQPTILSHSEKKKECLLSSWHIPDSSVFELVLSRLTVPTKVHSRNLFF